jgi:hypothetical protein
MSRRKAIAEAVGDWLAVRIGTVWGLGIPIGTIYWTMNGNPLNVVLSIVVPVYGTVSTLTDTLF